MVVANTRTISQNCRYQHSSHGIAETEFSGNCLDEVYLYF